MCPCYRYTMFYCLAKVQKLLSILTSKHVSPLTRGKVFSACICSALLHGSETWAPTAPDLHRLRRNDRGMIRWICSVKPHDAKNWTSERVCHVARASSWTKSITSIAIPGPRERGRPRKSWSECVKADVDVCNLEGIDLQNREAWKSGVRRTKVSNGAKIRNRYNQVPHLTQDTNGKVTNSQKTPQTRAKRSALSQQVTTKHI